jgi:hypothetical protein
MNTSSFKITDSPSSSVARGGVEARSDNVRVELAVDVDEGAYDMIVARGDAVILTENDQFDGNDRRLLCKSLSNGSSRRQRRLRGAWSFPNRS